MRYLENLSTQAALPGRPWEFVNRGQLPQEVRADKSLRDKWINFPTTKWNVYSMWEGLNENARINKAKGDTTDENPPLRIHGFAVDYDAQLSEDEVASGLARLAPLAPNYYERSLSGKCHLVWVLSKPITVSGWTLAKAFLELAIDKLRLRGALPMFDEKAFCNPSIYLTNSGDWFHIHDEPLSAALALGWLVEASAKINWAEEGYNVPLEKVRDELAKDPKFTNSEWAGIDFKLDAQGPTWWIEGSKSPKSAVVKASGMFTFSATATKSFYTWADLLGHAFVDQYRSKRIGDAVDGIFFDGLSFWRSLGRGAWKSWTKDDIRGFMKCDLGLSPVPAKGEMVSELERAYQFIQEHHNVDGAAPFAFKPNGQITVHGAPFLNTHTTRVLQPAAELTPWGPTGGFPTLSQFFGPPSTVDSSDDAPRLFKGGVRPVDTFISWLAHFYKCCYELDLQSGCHVFVSGPANIGKTFLNREIVGQLMNGYAEADDFLMGVDDFGAELFKVALWVVDDNAVSTTAARHRQWSEALKKMAANRTFVFHEKFRNRQQVSWEGRILATLNADEESARLIPNLEMSIVDKLHLYRTQDQPTIRFGTMAENRAMLKRELPYFAKFLLNWTTPEYCIQRRPNGDPDYRFGGVAPWHDPSLVQHANLTSSTSGFYEILRSWLDEYLTLANEGRKGDDRITSWVGTAFELRKAMCAGDPSTLDALRGTSVNGISTSLSQLRTKGHRISLEDRNNLRYWTLYSDT